MVVNVHREKFHFKNQTVSSIREDDVQAYLLIQVILVTMTGASFSTYLYFALWLQLGVFP